ncbi:LysM peptidoglycan-binding domain-containing protein [Agromyces atrinae]|uniref:LysM peptidoglycan-binding domain-containing protein n=1 Tax=Agromyces atrinae TaxID=592376 RepID=A0A4Q2M8F7_9MICO|nr:LysM domain-containing protein [Agromyces atrinae]NYD65936.1 LysM repeat protein [Agromyces atrinae]RXZ86271.1 LysM peptidoglycan-binding domain-containing protein [Agromyces atrinae]
MTGIGRLVSVPVAIVSAVAVTFGVATPAEANPTVSKRPPKAKAITPEVRTAGARVATEAAPVEYTVQSGDTISGVAERFGLPTASVLARNGLSWSSLIFPGQVLALVDAAAARPAPAEIRRHTVADGETISGIAASYGLSTSDVLSANGLGPQSLIFAGQSIVLPDSASPVPAAAVAPAPPAAAPTTHTVVAGDTISGIAERLGTSIQAVLDANGLDWSSVIHPGDVISLPGAPVPAAIVTPVDVAGLTDEMAANARVIIAVGRELALGDQAIVIALAAAAQESGLVNVDYGDRDSLGLFQQRPSMGWGTEAEVRDPTRAARAFYGGPSSPTGGEPRGLIDIPGWETMSVTDAAQAVQLSAHPDLYAQWEGPARTWLSVLG